jgi:hypothetical protein
MVAPGSTEVGYRRDSVAPTPSLSPPTNALDQRVFLRIAPELYLKRLIGDG